MYILFINLGSKCDIFFSNQFNNNSNKKNYPTNGFNPTQPNPYGLGWIGFDLCDGLDWIKKKIDPAWWVGSKNPLNPTHTHPYCCLIMMVMLICFW